MNLPDEGKGDIKISTRVKLLIKNMFSNKASNWTKTKEMNEAGPKTKQEVRIEMDAKLKAEQAQRDNDRRDNYNNRDNNNRGGNDRGNRNQKGDKKRYDGKDGQKVYKAKEPSSPSKKGRGQKEQTIQIVEIGDDEMGEALKANFEAYVTKQSDEN